MRYVTPLIHSVKGTVKRRPWRSGIIGVVVLLVLFFIYRGTRAAPPEYVTAPVEQGDLRQTVEAVGTVISERDLKLQFPTSGIVAHVAVKEGDKVKAGQRLAWLKAGDLAASVSVQLANLRSAEAQFQAMQEGARPEDIAIAEADVMNKRASLQAARASLANAEETLRTSKEKLVALEQEAETGLMGQRTIALSAAAEQISSAQSALANVDSVFSNNDLLDIFVKGDPGRYDLIHAQRLSVGTTLLTLGAQLGKASTNQEVLDAMQQVRSALSTANLVVTQAFDFVSGLPTSGYFTQTNKDAYKNTLDLQRSKMQNAMSGLDMATKSLNDAAASFNTRIASEKSMLTSAEGTKERAQADIRTFETSLLTTEAQLNLKRAPSRPTDIATAAARVQQAAGDLRRVQAIYSNTILTAPIDGTITQVSVKPGEALPTGAAITLLGTSPYRIEMFVSEIDIPKVQATQSGSVELDAFPGTHMKLKVSDVDTAPTDKDGVSKYRVKLDFVHPHNELKIGMTGDAEVTTGEKPNVVFAPRRAVLERDDGTTYVRVFQEDGAVEERTVTMGMEGGAGDVEIVTGLKQGETIVVLTKS